MTANDHQIAPTESIARTSNQIGWYAALLTTIITLITFGLAIIAVPISGANCREGCITYPYVETIAQFPHDYLWMPPAMLLLLAYVSLMASIHTTAAGNERVYSHISLSFAIIAASILLSTYFLQIAVVPASLLHNETEGIPLLTQYNPHGIFIALEELGYLIMSLSFVFMAPVFAHKSRRETAIRWIFIGGFLATITSLIVIVSTYGLERKDRFEVAVLSINWLVLLLSGYLLQSVLRRRQP